MLGWWDGGAFRKATARLVNVNPGGVLLDVDALVPTGGPVWIWSASADEAGWIEASFRIVTRPLAGPHRLRVIFRQSALTFSQAVIGVWSRGDPTRPALEPSLRSSLERLGLGWPCTEEDIHASYRRLAKTLHPDRGGSDRAFIRLSEDYRAMLTACRSSRP